MLVMQDTVMTDTDDMTPDERAALADSITDADIQTFLTLIKDRITVRVPPKNDPNAIFRNYVLGGAVDCAVNNWDDECRGVTIFLTD